MSERNIRKVILKNTKQIALPEKYIEIKPRSLPQISMACQLSKEESYTHYFDPWYIKVLRRLNRSLLRVMMNNKN